MEEKYIRWKPSPIITDDYLVETIIYRPEETIVILSIIEPEKKLIKLNFKDSVVLHRVCDEGVRQDLYKILENTFHERNHIKYGGRYLVENSKLVKWLVKESGCLDGSELKHFILMGDDDIFDVVSHSDPDIEVVK
ncbi:hypothetical protein K9L05_02450 [Candidatus Babeliales bacterium]|nr:hypothetical protein [Candidatus Babeliales bacterium]MCF7899486.1 hypothetical protein [Candidatus Babeliales bacterium]